MIEQRRGKFLDQLISEQKRLTGISWPYILGYILLTGAPYVYLDIYHWDSDVAYVWAGVFVWALSYLLLLRIMASGGYFAKGKTSGVGTYVALGVVMLMAVGLALVVLILPGLYLLMRWLPAYARALTAEEWITDTLRWSWRATEPVQRPLALAMLGPALLYAISFVAAYSYDLDLPLAYEVSTVLSNLAGGAGAVWLEVLGVAAFALLAENEDDAGQAVMPA